MQIIINQGTLIISDNEIAVQDIDTKEKTLVSSQSFLLIENHYKDGDKVNYVKLNQLFKSEQVLRKAKSDNKGDYCVLICPVCGLGC